MSTVRRFDFAGVIDLRNKMREDGTLRFPESPITRAGVFEYTQADGSTRREYRPQDEVEKALASFDLVPVTVDHPWDFISSGNARDYIVGAMANPRIRPEDGHAIADVAVYATSAIETIRQGVVELSVGFGCEVDPTPGISPEGERYDVIQRNIVGNHLSIVPRGRVGTAHLKLDSLDACTGHAVAAQTKEDTMDLETLKAELAAATERLTALEAKLQAAEGERDAAKATADAAESKRADAEASVLARAAVRAQLLTTADRFGVKDATDKSDRDVRVAVIAAVDGVQIAADKADEYVSAWFDSAIQRSEASRGSFRALKITQDKAPQSTTELAAKYNRYAKKETK